MSSDPLRVPFKLGSYKLAHRIVLASMTRMRASAEGMPNAPAAAYYCERTIPGSLLISEGVVISPRGRGFPNTPGLYNEEQVQAWKPITQAVKDKGGVFFAQIWHVGRVSVLSQTGGLPPLASTKRPLPGNHLLFGGENSLEPYVDSEAMTREQIKSTVEECAQAARNAIEAGFDGVEIHGGNGYLLDTFVHDNINDRTDEYGGTLQNRLRFPLEVVNAVAAAIGPNRTAIRIAPYHVLQETLDSNRVSTFSAYVAELEKINLAYVHLVEPRYDQLSKEGAFSASIERNPKSASTALIEEATTGSSDTQEPSPSLWPFRKLLNQTPVIGAGGYDGTSARDAIREGRVDLVAFGRAFTSNPDLPRRLFESLPLTKYDRATFYTPDERGYLGWEFFDERSEGYRVET